MLSTVAQDWTRDVLPRVAFPSSGNLDTLRRETAVFENMATFRMEESEVHCACVCVCVCLCVCVCVRVRACV